MCGRLSGKLLLGCKSSSLPTNSHLRKVPQSALTAHSPLHCSTAFFCAEQGGVGPGSSVAIFGLGPVGLLTVMAALHLGAQKVSNLA